MTYPGVPQANEHQPSDQGSPGAAITAGIAGLLFASVLVWQNFDLLAEVGEDRELTGSWTAMVTLHFIVAFLALLGAVLVFARLLAGAYVLMISAVVGAGLVLAAPVLFPGIDQIVRNISLDFTGEDPAVYFSELFVEFDNLQGVLRGTVVALGVLLLILAVVAASLRWLRRPRA